MYNYIKIIAAKAEPMTYEEAYKNGIIPENSYVQELGGTPGYLITEMNGKRDWEPQDSFDDEFHKIDGMLFAKAIGALKVGLKVARKGWNGRFLWLKPAAKVKAEWCKDSMLKGLAEANGGEIEALGTICEFTEQKQIISGWTPSQTDILSDDWIIVD